MKNVPYIKSQKHVVAPWIVNYQETSYRRPSERILYAGILGDYANSVRNFGYYVAKNKPFIMNHNHMCNTRLSPTKVINLFKTDITRTENVSILSKQFQSTHANWFTLPLTTRCHFDGIAPYSKYRVKQRYDIGDVDFRSFIRTARPHITIYDNSLYGYMGLPGYEGMMHDLRKFTVPIQKSFTKDDLFNAVNLIKNELVLPRCHKPLKSELLATYANDKAYSGVMTSFMAGRTKEESLEFSTIIAENLYDVVGARLSVDTSLKVVGARERIINDEKIGESMQTRALIQEESAISQLKQLYARQVTEGFKQLNVKWESPVSIGGVLLGSGVMPFFEKFYPKDGKEYKVVTMDASSHDKNVCEELLIMAYSILRSCFPKSKLIDKHFFFFMSGHVYKRIMTDDGLIFRIDGGIQTGDPFTSLINSICMLLEKTILYTTLGIPLPIKRCYYGDDQIELFNGDVNIPHNIGELSSAIIGVTMKDVIIKNTSEDFSEDYSREPSFLQIFNRNGLPERDPARIFEKLKYLDPKIRNDKYGKIEAILSMAYTSCGTNDTRSLVISYAKWLRKVYKLNYSKSMDDKLDDVVNKLIGTNFGIKQDNMRGEVGYVRKRRVCCNYNKYKDLKANMLTVQPLHLNHLLGWVFKSDTERIRNRIRFLKHHWREVNKLIECNTNRFEGWDFNKFVQGGAYWENPYGF